jgi:dephospho-CoA kinase
MKVILLSGKARSGKDTAAEVIFGKYDGIPLAFADDIKTIAYDYFGWHGEKDELGRKLLQDIGTTGRNYNRDIWVNDTIDKIQWWTRQSSDNQLAVVTDTRYPNEIQQIKHEFSDVATIRITRDSVEKLKHPSETALDQWTDWDYVVENNGTKEEFKTKILEIMEGVI